MMHMASGQTEPLSQLGEVRAVGVHTSLKVTDEVMTVFLCFLMKT